MEGRRTLTYANLDEVQADVERLLEGHRTVGGWSLGQICAHLAATITATLAGGPFWRAPGTVEGEGPVRRRKFFERGRMRDGLPIPDASLRPPAEVDARAGAEALREALARFAAAPDPLGDHPILGPLTRDEWAHFHRIHCAHHLGYAVPDDRPT